jgi:hypothetical protein
MPLTNPMRLDSPGLSAETDWLHRALSAVARDGKPLKRSVIEHLVAMLAPGPRRPDGLRAYWPAEPNVDQTQAWAALKQRDGSLGRAILAAVATDLQGHSLNHVSGALLQRHDHEIPVAGLPLRQDGDARAPRAKRETGRALLAVLGAWPWTHAPDGRLSARWHSSADYLDPLRQWHDAALAELERECELARSAWSGEG